MTHAERYAWLSLAAWTAILLFLLTRFTDGVNILGASIGFTLVDQPPGRLLWTYATFVVAVIVAESAIAGGRAASARGQAVERDERDDVIERRANLAAYAFVAGALNVVVLHVLLDAAYAGYERSIPLRIDLTGVTGVAFALLLVLTGAEIVKRVALIWGYRAA